MFSSLPLHIRQYLIITGNYWVFTLSDGALRMLIVLHFHQLGFSPLKIALLFLFYELFGVITNLVGGWLGARLGLNKTMNMGLALQIIALLALTVPPDWLTVAWVMTAQALSGIAKDLNKMSAKSSIKALVPKDEQGRLYQWVSWLTGSKNALKGVGFFLGGACLTWFGFISTVWIMVVVLSLVWLCSLCTLRQDVGKAKVKPKFQDIFSTSRAVNVLSAARLFLFGARDVWFVVALPIYLAHVFGWDHWQVGSFLAMWVIGYGIVQACTPYLTLHRSGKLPDGKSVFLWALALMLSAIGIAVGLGHAALNPKYVLIGGLSLFGVLFAINSSLHSYLIVRYAKEEGTSLDIGFYYMSNALGRLIGTILSGWIFQLSGIMACLWISTIFIACAAFISLALPRR